jgi:hypothetical protein
MNEDDLVHAKSSETSQSEDCKPIVQKTSPASSPCAASHGSALSPAGLADALEMSMGSRAGDSSVSNDSTSICSGMPGMESGGRVGNSQLANSGTSSPVSLRNSVSKSRRRSDRVRCHILNILQSN